MRNKRGIGKCPLCKEGTIYENSKSFYCNKWKSGCKFSIWKNSLDIYGQKMDRDKITSIIKYGKVDNILITLPQTGEKGIASLKLNTEIYTGFEIINFTRIK